MHFVYILTRLFLKILDKKSRIFYFNHVLIKLIHL